MPTTDHKSTVTLTRVRYSLICFNVRSIEWDGENYIACVTLHEFRILSYRGKNGKKTPKKCSQFPRKKTFVGCMMGKKSVTQASERYSFLKTEKNAI